MENLFKPRRIEDREKELQIFFLNNEKKFLKFIKNLVKSEEENITINDITFMVTVFSRNDNCVFYVNHLYKVCNFKHKYWMQLSNSLKMDWSELQDFLAIMFEKHLNITDIESFN